MSKKTGLYQIVLTADVHDKNDKSCAIETKVPYLSESEQEARRLFVKILMGFGLQVKNVQVVSIIDHEILNDEDSEA